MKIIGLDVGEKRIGVAKVDSNTRIAVPVGTVLADGSEWQEIARIARINSTNFFVLGLPRSNEGNETKQTLYVRNFAKALTEKIPGVKVRFQDESLTSVEAEERLRARKKRYEKGEIDAEAATIILQDFIENFKKDGENVAENAPETALTAPTGPVKEATARLQGIAKKESEKAKLRARRLKKALIISPIALVVIITGVIGVVAWRQAEAKRRQEMWAEMEAQMTPEVFNFTIRPGETIFDVQRSLREAGYSEAEITAGFAADYSAKPGLEFLKERPTGASLEGFLYGETHEFYKSATVEDILTVFLTGMGQAIRENNLEAKYKKQRLSLFEGITLASVVQKEAAPADQPTVAQVFLSRLDYGMTLGSDVTVSYALDVLDPEREIYSDNAAALEVDSCYNTRLYPGLPCGPIANPSLTALLAVAEPTDSDYLFFLTGDDGMMYYSYTESEHLQNARLHCAVLCNVSL